MTLSNLDPLGLFFAFFIASSGAILWLIDHLTKLRDANRDEAMRIRVVGSDWKHGMYRQMPWLDRSWLREHVDRAMRGGY
jgi:hypothetical protein